MDVVSEYQFTKKHRIDGGEGKNSLGVYEAFDHQVRSDVAVKILDKSTFRDAGEFFREAQAMFHSEHRNVISIKVASQNDDQIFLSMPLYRRGSLAKRIANGPLPLREVRRVGQHILAGLGAIHAANTIHFDIKPTNILFSDQNVAMIADFGQAREIGPGGVTLMPDKMYAPGTPPEAFTSARRGTVESDVYQAGLTLYRAANGEPFFDQQYQRAALDLQNRIVTGKFPIRSAFLPHIPDRLCRLIRKAINVDPSKRFPSAAAFANALTRVTIQNNWEATLLPNNGMQWQTTENGLTRVISIRKEGLGWDLTMHEGRNKMRRWMTAHWREGITLADGQTVLSQLFAALA